MITVLMFRLAVGLFVAVVESNTSVLACLHSPQYWRVFTGWWYPLGTGYSHGSGRDLAWFQEPKTPWSGLDLAWIWPGSGLVYGFQEPQTHSSEFSSPHSFVFFVFVLPWSEVCSARVTSLLLLLFSHGLIS